MMAASLGLSRLEVTATPTIPCCFISEGEYFSLTEVAAASSCAVGWASIAREFFWSSAVEAAVNTDGENGGIGHQLRGALIFCGVRARNFGGGWFRGGGLRGGCTESVGARRSASGDGSAARRTD